MNDDEGHVGPGLATVEERLASPLFLPHGMDVPKHTRVVFTGNRLRIVTDLRLGGTS